MRWERGIRLAPLPDASRKAAAASHSLRVPSSAASSSVHVHAHFKSETSHPHLDLMLAVGSTADCAALLQVLHAMMPNPPCDGTGVALEATACARAAAARGDRLLLYRRLVLWQGAALRAAPCDALCFCLDRCKCATCCCICTVDDEVSLPKPASMLALISAGQVPCCKSAAGFDTQIALAMAQPLGV